MFNWPLLINANGFTVIGGRKCCRIEDWLPFSTKLPSRPEVVVIFAVSSETVAPLIPKPVESVTKPLILMVKELHNEAANAITRKEFIIRTREPPAGNGVTTTLLKTFSVCIKQYMHKRKARRMEGTGGHQARLASSHD